jgi:ABC-2 type transport system permease protein
MIWTLVKKYLRDVRLPLCVVFVIIVGFQCLWVKVSQRAVTQLSPFFSTIASRAGLFQSQLEDQIFSGPGRIVQTLAGGERIHFERAMDMLSIGYMHPLMLIVFCLWGIGRASSAIAGEVDRGTAELLLSQPIRRRDIVFANLAVDLLVIPILALAMWAGTTLGFYLVGQFVVRPEDIENLFGGLPFKIIVQPELLATNLWAFGPALVNVAALIFAVSGITIALSAGGRYRNRVIGWAVVIVLVQFIANLVGQMWDGARWARPFTVFYYYQPQRIILNDSWRVDLLAGLATEPFQVPFVAILIGVGIAGYLVALVTFSRRDLPAPL